MLECSDGSLYTGWAWNAYDREKKHNEGKGSKYVRSRLPAKLVYVEPCSDKSAAMRRENVIKAMSREHKLQLVRDSEWQR
jgi:putative endonuclease